MRLRLTLGEAGGEEGFAVWPPVRGKRRMVVRNGVSLCTMCAPSRYGTR
jgi:hypothetical protein